MDTSPSSACVLPLRDLCLHSPDSGPWRFRVQDREPLACPAFHVNFSVSSSFISDRMKSKITSCCSQDTLTTKAHEAGRKKVLHANPGCGRAGAAVGVTNQKTDLETSPAGDEGDIHDDTQARSSERHKPPRTCMVLSSEFRIHRAGLPEPNPQSRSES